MVQMLRRDIISGGIKPGERINELEISKKFHMSRGPIREALIQLEEEGLVTYQPYRGCIVRTLSYEEMEEGHLIRCTLEKLAIRMYSGILEKELQKKLSENIRLMGNAAKEKDIYRIIELDEQFHGYLVEASYSKKLYKLWKALESSSVASYYTMYAENLVPFQVIEKNHQKILDAFQEKKSVEEIESIMEEHYMAVPQALYEKNKNQKEEKA